MKRLLLLIYCIGFALFSCAHVLTKEGREGEMKNIPFKDVRHDIDKYRGSLLVLGGSIIHTKGIINGTLVEVLQHPVDEYGVISDLDYSEGRFIATTKEDLDPLIYEKGRLLTISGIINGTMEMNISEVRKYTYPLIEIKEIYLWREDSYPIFFPSYRVAPPSWGNPWWNYPYSSSRP